MPQASSSKKILVVDDDKALTTLLSNMLSNYGHQVLVAHNGLDALAQVKSHVPDLIILDIMMPEINGYDVCREIKFDQKLKTIPILVLTSRERELDTRIGQLMGIDYMQKPIDTKLLLEKIQNTLK